MHYKDFKELSEELNRRFPSNENDDPMVYNDFELDRLSSYEKIPEDFLYAQKFLGDWFTPLNRRQTIIGLKKKRAKISYERKQMMESLYD